MKQKYEVFAYLYDVNTVEFGVKNAETGVVVHEAFATIGAAEKCAKQLNNE